MVLKKIIKKIKKLLVNRRAKELIVKRNTCSLAISPIKEQNPGLSLVLTM